MTDDESNGSRQYFTRSRLVEHEQWYGQRSVADPGWRIDPAGKNLRGARVRGIEGARLLDYLDLGKVGVERREGRQ